MSYIYFSSSSGSCFFVSLVLFGGFWGVLVVFCFLGFFKFYFVWGLFGFYFLFLDFRSFWGLIFPCVFMVSLTFAVLTEFLPVEGPNISDGAEFLIRDLLTEDFGMPPLSKN